jgi:hypothetical protein
LSVTDSVTRLLRSLVRAQVGAHVRISDTRVRNVPELTRCGTPLSVAIDVTDRPVQDRAVSVICARKAVARIIPGILEKSAALVKILRQRIRSARKLTQWTFSSSAGHRRLHASNPE